MTESEASNGTQSTLDQPYHTQSGPIYQIYRDDQRRVLGSLPGCPPGNKDKPNTQKADVAVIEFKDTGAFWEDKQLKQTLDCIQTASGTNRRGLIVVVFVHGWRHNASWDYRTADGDDHFRSFREVLITLALREAERYEKGKESGRRVIGVYMGWRGLSASWRIMPSLREVPTFKDRLKTADKIGNGSDFQEALWQIVRRTKLLNNQSPVVVIGHSMGARMLETAFARFFQDGRIGEPGNRLTQTTGCSKIISGNDAIIFPDSILLLNSAAESSIAAELISQIGRNRLKKLIGCNDQPYGSSFEGPLFISASSEADWYTRKPFWVGTGGKETDGNSEALQTHVLTRNEKEPSGNCSALEDEHMAIDFKQSWHCLRPPNVDGQNQMIAINIDLPRREDLRLKIRNTCHDRYQLKHRGVSGQRAAPFWVLQVPADIVGGHNDIFNARASLMLMGLVQVSGGVMSLSKDYSETFDRRPEGLC